MPKFSIVAQMHDELCSQSVHEHTMSVKGYDDFCDKEETQMASTWRTMHSFRPELFNWPVQGQHGMDRSRRQRFAKSGSKVDVGHHEFKVSVEEYIPPCKGQI
eukprot:scaffold180761_cov18-Prasinocladus_malaysianus.AAC.1